MKKLSIITIFVLMMSMMVPVFANEITTPGNQTVNVTYEATGSYKITIPTDVDFTKPETQTQTVSASDVLLEYGKELNVTVSSTNYANDTWNLVDTGDGNGANKLTYEIKCDGANVVSGGKVLSVEAGNTNGDENELTFAITGNKNVAGSYLDTLTFTVSVDTASAN